MTDSLQFKHVAIRNFRNLHQVVFEPGARINVISGDNGQGKTSLLEALYFVATSKSFRTERARELVQQGEPVASVVARICDAGSEHEQRAAVSNGRRALSLAGKRPATTSDYALRTPVVVFHPGDLQIVSGAATPRRLLLDRIALYLEPTSSEHRARFTQANRERQRALQVNGSEARELDAFEAIMADEGAALTRCRQRTAAALADELLPCFRELAPTHLTLEARFVAGGPSERDAYAALLRVDRARDAHRASASHGPHRDDLELLIEGRTARHHASQGQQRILALAVKTAELACVRRARNLEPVLLLDDVSSELDPQRAGAVYEYLRSQPSQVFVSTTRPDLFVTVNLTPSDRQDWRLDGGRLSLSGERSVR